MCCKRLVGLLLSPKRPNVLGATLAPPCPRLLTPLPTPRQGQPASADLATTLAVAAWQQPSPLWRLSGHRSQNLGRHSRRGSRLARHGHRRICPNACAAPVSPGLPRPAVTAPVDRATTAATAATAPAAAGPPPALPRSPRFPVRQCAASIHPAMGAPPL